MLKKNSILKTKPPPQTKFPYGSLGIKSAGNFHGEFTEERKTKNLNKFRRHFQKETLFICGQMGLDGKPISFSGRPFGNHNKDDYIFCLYGGKTDGTSYAAALISGLAARLKYLYPKFTYKEIRNIIAVSAHKYILIRKGGIFWKQSLLEDQYGQGLASAKNAEKLAEKVNQYKQVLTSICNMNHFITKSEIRNLYGKIRKYALFLPREYVRNDGEYKSWLKEKYPNSCSKHVYDNILILLKNIVYEGIEEFDIITGWVNSVLQFSMYDEEHERKDSNIKTIELGEAIFNLISNLPRDHNYYNILQQFNTFFENPYFSQRLFNDYYMRYEGTETTFSYHASLHAYFQFDILGQLWLITPWKDKSQFQDLVQDPSTYWPGRKILLNHIKVFKYLSNQISQQKLINCDLTFYANSETKSVEKVTPSYSNNQNNENIEVKSSQDSPTYNYNMNYPPPYKKTNLSQMYKSYEGEKFCQKLERHRKKLESQINDPIAKDNNQSNSLSSLERIELERSREKAINKSEEERKSVLRLLLM